MGRFTMFAILVSVLAVVAELSAISMAGMHGRPLPSSVRLRREPPPSYYGSQQASYGPPKMRYYRQNKPAYGPPKMRYGPPPPKYGAVKYGPPPMRYGPPPKRYGPPKMMYVPPKMVYRPSRPSYGAPLPKYVPHKPSYGQLPKQHYGQPPKQSHGQSHSQSFGLPPKGAYSFPTASYGMPELNHNAPTSIYGSPSNPLDFTASNTFGGKPSASSHGSGDGQSVRPLSSYDVPSNSVSELYAGEPEPSPANTYESPEISYGAPKPASDYGSPALLNSYASSPSSSSASASQGYHTFAAPEIKYGSPTSGYVAPPANFAATHSLGQGGVVQGGTSSVSASYVPDTSTLNKPVKSVSYELPATSYSSFQLGPSRPADKPHGGYPFETIDSAFEGHAFGAHGHKTASHATAHNPFGSFDAEAFAYPSSDSHNAASNAHSYREQGGHPRQPQQHGGQWHSFRGQVADVHPSETSVHDTYDTISGSLSAAFAEQDAKEAAGQPEEGEGQSASSAGTSFQAPSQTYRFTPSHQHQQEEPTKSQVTFPSDAKHHDFHRHNAGSTSEDFRSNGATATSSNEELSPNYFASVDAAGSEYGTKINAKIPNGGEKAKRVPSRNNVRFDSDREEDTSDIVVATSFSHEGPTPGVEARQVDARVSP